MYIPISDRPVARVTLLCFCDFAYILILYTYSIEKSSCCKIGNKTEVTTYFLFIRRDEKMFVVYTSLLVSTISRDNYLQMISSFSRPIEVLYVT